MLSDAADFGFLAFGETVPVYPIGNNRELLSGPLERFHQAVPHVVAAHDGLNRGLTQSGFQLVDLAIQFVDNMTIVPTPFL